VLFSFDVLVEDCEDPVIMCTDELDVACGTEDLAAWIAAISATVTDNCDPLADLVVTNQLITDFSSCGGTFNQVYEFTVTDQAGNTGTCLATYMTIDDVPPIIDPMAMDMTVECDGGEGAALLAWLASNGGAAATDACSEPVTWTNNYAGQFDAACGGTGSTTVIFTATDACGNVSLISSWLGTGVVFDDCSGAITYTTDYPDVFAPTCGAAGVYTVTFTLMDECMNMTTCVRTITIEDNTAPTIDLDASDLVLECADPGNAAAITAWLASNGGAVASDACSVINPLTDWSNDGGIVVAGCGSTTTTTYIFTVLDDCMNPSTTTASIILIDNIPPTLTAPSNIVEECGNVVTDVAAWIAMAAATDDCDAAPVIDAVLWNTVSGCGGTNVETYLFTATDACGNESTAFADYTLEDTGIPTIVCPMPLELECANPDNDQLILQWLAAATATDEFDCSAVTITHDYPGGLPANCGAPGIDVTFTATDDCGNAITCMSTITMVDTQAPVWLNCPMDMTVNVDVDLCETNVVYSQPIAVDACDDALTITPAAANIPSGMPFPLGTTTISYTATDACGNVSAVCSFDITVVDSDVPSIDCPSNTVVVCNATGTCTWPSDDSVNSLTADNCTGSTFTHDIVSADGSIDVVGAAGNVPAGTLFPLGVSTITYTITDASGNSATCSFDVLVEDCEDPVITCSDELAVACGSEDLTTWMDNIAATVTDNCDALADLVVTNQLITDFSSCGGTFEQVYQFTVTDQAGNTGTCLATYMTIDDVPPVIVDAVDETVECTGGSQSTALLAWLNNNGGATATDACSEPITWTNDFTGDLVPNCTDGITGSVLVTFTATDACGNSSETMATFTIEDTTSPDLFCPDNLELECSSPLNETIINNWLNSALSGVYTVTFTTMDACDNVRTCNRTITLTDSTPPTIDLPATDLVLECADPGNAAAIAAWLASNGGAVASDDCSVVNPLTNWSNDGGTVVPGCGANTSTTYVFTVLDDCLNASTTSASIILEDNIPPVLTPPSDIVEECGNIVTDVATWIATATATDDCGAVPSIDAVLWNTISGCGGTNTEVYLFTATDDCGNETTGLANYSLEDTGIPTIVCPMPLELECANPDNDQLILEWLESATATDEFDCSDVTITHDYPGGLPGACGAPVITVTFTATDDCDNLITCTSTITMMDTQAPVWLNCPADMTVNVDVDLCETNVVYSTPIAFDACDDDLIITPGGTNIPSGMPFPLGTTTISYTATDDCGNVSAVCSFDITVVDSDVPSIDCPSNTVVQCTANGTCTWPSDASINSLTADNCPGSTFTHDIVSADGSIDVVAATGNVPAGTLFPLGTSTVTYTITDAAGNSASCSFNVLIEDCEDPVITCTDELDVACGAEDVATWMAGIAATVTDNCDALADLVVSNQLVTDFSSCGGTFEQTYLFTVTDQAGNTGTCLATYSTVDDIPPVIDPMAEDLTVECDGGENAALLAWLADNGGAMATDACSGPVTWTNDYVGVFTADCGGTGSTTVTFTATDACGNSSTTTAVFTIIDSTVPELSCPDNIVLECGDPVNDAVITNWLGNGIALCKNNYDRR